jgi:NDP-sugar pyrophosphorylase family protein
MTGRTMALIMAGGEGRRMARSQPGVPKALVEVAGFPLIVLSIRRLAEAGIRDIRVSVHHRAQEIIHELRRRSDIPQAGLEFIVEEEPLGTIGALAEFRDLCGDVLVQNADLLSGIDLRAMLSRHRERDADVTIATHIEYHRLKLGEVLTRSKGEVVEYSEKPIKQYRISSGTYVVSPGSLSICEPSVYSPLPDFVNLAIEGGKRVIEFHHDAPWIDVNDEADLIRAQTMFEEDPVAFGIHPRERDAQSEEAS